MDWISTHTGIPEDDLLKWPVRRFYTKVKMLSWKAYVDKEYTKITTK